MPLLQGDDEIREVLKEVRRVAVVGFSEDPSKPAHYVPRVLREKGFEVMGVNPKYAGREIAGITVYGDLEEIEGPVDVVVVFRPEKEVPEVARRALRKGFKVFWMQPGTVNEEVKEELVGKGYKVVAGRCMKVESERLL